MELTPANSLPPSIKRLLSQQVPGAARTPGFLIGVDPILSHDPSLQACAARILPQPVRRGSPCLVVNPNQTPAIFAHEAELDLARTVAGFVLQQIDPRLKIGVDALWLVFGASKLYYDWSQPGSDKGLCLFNVVGLGLDGMSLAGSCYPGLAVPDHWANGINFIAVGAQAVYQGKTIPMNEMILSSDKQMELPLKLLKAAGVALDPAPQFQSIAALPLFAGTQSGQQQAPNKPPNRS